MIEPKAPGFELNTIKTTVILLLQSPQKDKEKNNLLKTGEQVSIK